MMRAKRHSLPKRSVWAFVLTGLAVVMVGFGVIAQETPRPNILLIVGDDIGFGDLGFAGAVTRTPNIDWLAGQGTLFTRFHASPVCSVSRAMLLTGNNSIEIGLGAFDYAIYPPAEGRPGYEAYLTRTTVTIAELLRDAGYLTAMVGKWHLGGTRHGGEGPHEWGFERSYAIYTGGANHWNDGVFHVDLHDPEVMAEVKAGRIPTEPYFEDGVKVERPLGVFSDTLWTNRLIAYLEEARKADKPFFAYLAFTTPHAPLQAPDWLIDKYIGHYLDSGFEGLKRARWESQKRYGILPEDAPMPDRATNSLLGRWDDLSPEEKRVQARMMATYSAMMESQDLHIGLLLNYLRETGRFDDTLLVYLSDNGPEGFDVDGELSNPAANRWVESNFSQDPADIGRGNAFGYIGTDWADSATGGLSWWKGFIGEGGVRVPVIVVPPSGAPFARSGERTAEFATVKDVPMTILDYAGVAHPGQSFGDRSIVPPSGISIRPFLEGEATTPRSESDWHAFELFGNAYVVQDDWKAIRVRPGMYGDGVWHLYDIRNDPGETNPLEAAMPERLAALVAIYEAYAEEKGIVPVNDEWNPWHGSSENGR
jgi:arylsulfatase